MLRTLGARRLAAHGFHGLANIAAELRRLAFFLLMFVAVSPSSRLAVTSFDFALVFSGVDREGRKGRR